MNFVELFQQLTGNPPFPWQTALYERFMSPSGEIPSSCNLPTGMGKTSVVAIWLIALANFPSQVPRRLVYVVNRRTVVDQTTSEVERFRREIESNPALGPLRVALSSLCAWEPKDGDGTPLSPLAISTLRGQFADNRTWSADPSRPAVIVGTVDMIGSRLLFSGYGIGHKLRPLHAGLLGHDSLVVHDEAHLEPAFQHLLLGIEREQRRFDGLRRFHVMELSATSRQGEAFALTDADRNHEIIRKRLFAKKSLSLHEVENEKVLAEQIAKLAMSHSSKGCAVLIFVRKVEDVEKIVKLLPDDATQQLTGTLRGLERDRMADPSKPEGRVFSRFQKRPESTDPLNDQPKIETVFLVCTSAGEVGVNISADHMVCDLSTFDSMTQRFGRLNRFGENDDSTISIVHPATLDESDDFDQRRARTLELLRELNADASPQSIDSIVKQNPDRRTAAFAPTPRILLASDSLFNAWSMTSIHGKLPGRPPVDPYLHGVEEWQPPETHVAWREEVWLIKGELLAEYPPAELLEDYPLKPHELLKENTNRVFDRLKRLDANPETPVWILDDDGNVDVSTLQGLSKEAIKSKTVVLPPSAGGLLSGLLTADAATANDVADELYFDDQRRRMRIRSNDADFESIRKKMRLIRAISFDRSDAADDEDSEQQADWCWFELPKCADGDQSRTTRQPVDLQTHTDDVLDRSNRISNALSLPEDLKSALGIAAKYHDLGKRRVVWQRAIGNPDPTNWLAKSGGKMVPTKLSISYRHEFGSLVDIHSLRQGHLVELRNLPEQARDIVLHLIAAHHGNGRPHFDPEFVVDPAPGAVDLRKLANEIVVRFGRLQQRLGPWALAYLESLLRAADYAASAEPSRCLSEK